MKAAKRHLPEQEKMCVSIKYWTLHNALKYVLFIFPGPPSDQSLSALSSYACAILPLNFIQQTILIRKPHVSGWVLPFNILCLDQVPYIYFTDNFSREIYFSMILVYRRDCSFLYFLFYYSLLKLSVISSLISEFSIAKLLIIIELCPLFVYVLIY